MDLLYLFLLSSYFESFDQHLPNTQPPETEAMLLKLSNKTILNRVRTSLRICINLNLPRFARCLQKKHHRESLWH